MLANLYNVPKDENELAQFSFSNNDEHVKLAAAMLSQKNIQLPIYVLDPLLPANKDIWLSVHQDLHNAIDIALGIAGNDLSDVDFHNPEQLSAWIWLHAQEHMQAAQKLGIT